MSRLEVKTPGQAQAVVEQLYRNMERRIAASPPGLCPVDMALNFLDLCRAQTCGKCVPCRIGLTQLSNMIREVLDGEPDLGILRRIEKTAQVIVDTADCAIGTDAASLVLMGLKGFRDDYEEHILHHRCLGSLKNPVPCVALCPAGVDIPGYIALIGEGRCEDAVRLIRKDNPFPTACAYICEHPCEARCRRNMVDDALNIRGLKRYAVDQAGDVPQPKRAKATGKSVAIIGGGPGGLSAAYYLALMGHKVTVYEKQKALGGMMRYGIPSYRFPREKLDGEIASILSLGIEVHTEVNVGTDVSFDELKQQYDCLYLSIGAHTDKKTGIPGEDSPGVVSAVEMLRAIGDNEMPDFTGKKIVVIGGGLVGTETALDLAENGHSVTLVEMLPKIMKDVAVTDFLAYSERIAKTDMRILTETRLEEVLDNGARVSAKKGEETIEADTVILALGLKAEQGLYNELAAAGKEVYLVGDAVKAGEIFDAIHTAYRVGLRI